MNTSKSQGPDELNPKLIHELRNELYKPLTFLFNMSLQTSVIPQDWRDASVAPLHKKGSKNKPENYRPVSLASIISKLLEYSQGQLSETSRNKQSDTQQST